MAKSILFVVVCVALVACVAAKIKQTSNCDAEDEECWKDWTDKNIDEIIDLAEDHGKDARKELSKIIREPGKLCETKKGDCQDWAHCQLADAVVGEYNNFLRKTSDCQGAKLNDLDDAVEEAENRETNVISVGKNAADDALDLVQDELNEARDECKLITDFTSKQRQQCRDLVHCAFMKESLLARFDDFVEIDEDKCPDPDDFVYIDFCDFACREQFYLDRLDQTFEKIQETAENDAGQTLEKLEDDTEDKLDLLCDTGGGECVRAQECVLTRKLLKKYDDYLEERNCGKDERRDAKEDENEAAYSFAREYRRDLLDEVKEKVDELEEQCEFYGDLTEVDQENAPVNEDQCELYMICAYFRDSLVEHFDEAVDLSDECQDILREDFLERTATTPQPTALPASA